MSFYYLITAAVLALHSFLRADHDAAARQNRMRVQPPQQLQNGRDRSTCHQRESLQSIFRTGIELPSFRGNPCVGANGLMCFRFGSLPAGFRFDCPACCGLSDRYSHLAIHHRKTTTPACEPSRFCHRIQSSDIHACQPCQPQGQLSHSYGEGFSARRIRQCLRCKRDIHAAWIAFPEPPDC